MAAVKCTFSRLWGLRREGLLHMEDIVGCKSSCGWEPREFEKIRILQPEVGPKGGILFETTVAFMNYCLWCSDFQTTEDLHLLTGWCATLKNWSPQKSLIRATSICWESSLLAFGGCLILRSFHGMLHKLRGSWRRVGLVIGTRPNICKTPMIWATLSVKMHCSHINTRLVNRKYTWVLDHSLHQHTLVFNLIFLIPRNNTLSELRKILYTGPLYWVHLPSRMLDDRFYTTYSCLLP